MKKPGLSLSLAFAFCLAVSTSANAAEVTFAFGDLLLNPGEASPLMQAEIDQPVANIAINFDFESTDPSWSRDVQVGVTDGAGNRVVFGDGFTPTEGGLFWSVGVPNGTDGVPQLNADPGNYGAIFTPDDWAIGFPAFGTGSPGTFSVNFQDGWPGGAATTFVGNATVVITTAVPEPSSAALLGLLVLGAVMRRRGRSAANVAQAKIESRSASRTVS